MITGNISTDCIKSSLVADASMTNSSGYRIELGFRPTYFYDYFPNLSSVDVWDSRIDNTLRTYRPSENTLTPDGIYTNWFTLDNTSLTIKNYSTAIIGQTMYYVACK